MPDHAARRARAVRRAARSRARRSGEEVVDALPQRRRRRARRRSARPSPTGSASGGSSGCERRGQRRTDGGRRLSTGRSARHAHASRGGVRARALADGLRGDRRPARHRDQARAAAAGLAAAGRARAVRAPRHRALDAAPGAHRADPERPRVRDARPRRRHVRLRPPAARRPAVAARCSRSGARPATSASRSSSAWRCSPPSARSRPTSTRSTRSRATLEDALEDFAAYRQADIRLHVGLAEATRSTRLVRAMTEVQGAMTDLISYIAHPPRGARLLQRPAPAAARRGARARRDARRARDDRAPAGHRARARGPAAGRLTRRGPRDARPRAAALAIRSRSRGCNLVAVALDFRPGSSVSSRAKDGRSNLFHEGASR